MAKKQNMTYTFAVSNCDQRLPPVQGPVTGTRDTRCTGLARQSSNPTRATVVPATLKF